MMFVGRYTYWGTSAAVSINQLLSDVDLMGWNRAAQADLDEMVDDLVDEVGLSDDEIIEIPVLFENVSFDGEEGMVAYTPNAVNSLVFDDTFVAAWPFGPNIDGVDGFAQDLVDRLTDPANELGSDGAGLYVYFTDDWDWYHVMDGEVHCGTNINGPPQQEIRWWEAME
jgi:protein-arginine deiminase